MKFLSNMSINIYKKQSVLFLDILGFSQLINSKSNEKIEAIMSISSAFSSRPESQSALSYVTAFSDSIVASYALELNGLKNTINMASQLTWCFAQQGVLIRGGISCGDMFHEKGKAYGPAMIDAYLTENKRAIFPRVVLSDSAISEVNNKKDEFMKMLHVDSDGELFVNIFSPNTLSPFKLPNKCEKDIISEKFSTISKLLKNPNPTIKSGDFVAKAKHAWMATYLANARKTQVS